MQRVETTRFKEFFRSFFHAGRMFVCSFALLLFLFSITGCNLVLAPFGALSPSVSFLRDQLAYNDPVDEFMLGWRNYVWAKKAWANYRSCHRDIKYLEDFGRGYRAGYVDVASGGDGCTPIMAPRRYWSWKYQTPEGQCKVQQWFAAFALGAAQAEKDGVNSWSQIQTSVDIEEHFHLKDKEALRGMTNLRESGSKVNLPNNVEELPVDPILNDPVLGPEDFNPPNNFNRGLDNLPDSPPNPVIPGVDNQRYEEGGVQEGEKQQPAASNDKEARYPSIPAMRRNDHFTSHYTGTTSSAQAQQQRARNYLIEKSGGIPRQELLRQPSFSPNRPKRFEPQIEQRNLSPQSHAVESEVMPVKQTPPVFSSAPLRRLPERPRLEIAQTIKKSAIPTSVGSNHSAIESNPIPQSVSQPLERSVIPTVPQAIKSPQLPVFIPKPEAPIQRLPVAEQSVKSLKRPEKVFSSIPSHIQSDAVPVQKPVLLKKP
jgi:hypothetical protein